jgi:hypothetical protein
MTDRPSKRALREMRRVSASIYKSKPNCTESEFRDMFVSKLSPSIAMKSVIVTILIKIAWELFLIWLKKRLSDPPLTPQKDEPDYEYFTKNDNS